jgi:K(+)-stimulated pyrophosphate-energized sodium pump
MSMILYLIPAVMVAALVYAMVISIRIGKYEVGTDRMKQISGYIANGAMSFLKAEYKILAIFVVIVGILLAVTADPHRSSPLIVIAFVVGALSSACAGFIGMRVATKANVRTTNAARTSLRKALHVSFSGGSVMGISVAALGILGLSLLFILFQSLFNGQGELGEPLKRVLEILTGFSLGAESIALFARVGGGIYTKAADVGADLVGKVEAGIPEDDPRNPAVIADNVGDNVGDVAGMGADLFGSYVSTVLATMVLGATIAGDVSGSTANDGFGGLSTVILPLVIAMVGLIFSIVGTWFVRIRENGNPQAALNKGNFGAIILTAIASYFVITGMLPETLTVYGTSYSSHNVFYTVVVGLVVGTLMSLITEFYCSMGKNPVNTIARQSISGAATNIISGLSVGMISTALPILVLAGGIVASYALAGIYGVAIAASGMMATTGIQLAIDAFGPIADNAGGIAEMSALPKEVREKTDILDTVGNTTAAIGKGFAIASAALTSLALFAAYKEITGVEIIDISKAEVLAGLFIGGMIPFLFSSLAMRAVGQAAMKMVVEVRRQFREITGLLEGKEGVEPDYDKCIQISTSAALRLMMLPGLLAILTPVIIGFGFNAMGFNGAQVLAAVLAGVAVSGVLMALFQSNAGGAWDNAKKSFEKGVEINGQMYYKGSDPHKAAVTGDTVGDPFKDTSGPSMNILIKLTAIVSLVIAPLLVKPGMNTEAPEVPAATSAASAAASLESLNGNYHIDAGHSFIGFTIRHWLSHARGSMNVDSGMIVMTGDPTTSSIRIHLNPATLNSSNADRDATLKDTDWFDAANHPSVDFSSAVITRLTGNPDYNYAAQGTLTMKGISHPVTLQFNYLGETITPRDEKVYSFEGKATINRLDFRVGGPNLPFLGDEADIEFSIEAN